MPDEQTKTLEDELEYDLDARCPVCAIASAEYQEWGTCPSCELFAVSV